MANLTDLTTLARDLLSRYTDAEILTSQTHTTPDEEEILERLNKVKRELGNSNRAMAQSAVVAVLRERRYAKRFANGSAFGGAFWTAK